MKISAEQKQFIQDNYTTMTVRDIAKKFEVGYTTILYHCKKLGIIFNKYKNNSNIEQFKNIEDPRITYFLGYLWADGSIGYLNKNKDKPRSIAIELAEKDYDYLESVVKNLFTYHVYKRKAKIASRQNQKRLTIEDMKLGDFLVKEMEFNQKSSKFSKRLFNAIPENLQHYFWRGFIDGDGYIGDYSVVIAASYNFDWEVLENLFKKLQIIKWEHRKYIYPKKPSYKFSNIRLGAVASLKFLDYIYNGYINDKIGLPRKYAKYTSRATRRKYIHKSL